MSQKTDESDRKRDYVCLPMRSQKRGRQKEMPDIYMEQHHRGIVSVSEMWSGRSVQCMLHVVVLVCLR